MGKFKFEIALNKFGFYEILMNNRALNGMSHSKEECEKEVKKLEKKFN